MRRDAVDFEKDRTSDLFRKLFVPTLIGSLSLSAVTAIDGIFIGHGLGTEALAAVNLIVPVWILFISIGLMLGIGSSVVMSIHLSKQNIKAARINLTQAMIASNVVVFIISVLILMFPSRTAILLGASEDLVPLVRDYLIGVTPGFIFQQWSLIGLFAIRLDGSPNVAMISNLLNGITNVLLDYLFIFPFGWGMLGAAAATGTSIFVGGAVAIWYFIFKAKKIRPIRIKSSITSIKLSIRNIGYQCRIGFPTFIGEFAMAVITFVGNFTFMHYLGTDGVSAFGVACYYTPFLFMVANAISTSAQPIISYNFGAGRREKISETERIITVSSLFFGVAVSLAFVLFPEVFVTLFIDSSTQAARIAIEGLPYFASGFLFLILDIVAIGYLQSLEKVKAPTIFSLLRGLILVVPAYIFLPKLFSTAGIWLSTAAADFITFLMILLYLLFMKRQGKLSHS